MRIAIAEGEEAMRNPIRGFCWRLPMSGSADASDAEGDDGDFFHHVL